MTKSSLVVCVVVVCLTILLFGLAIWPTPYRYEVVTQAWRGQDSSFQEVYRINRFTGEAEKVVSPLKERSPEETKAPETDDGWKDQAHSSLRRTLLAFVLTPVIYFLLFWGPRLLGRRAKTPPDPLR